MSTVTYLHTSPVAKRAGICNAIAYAANRSKLPLRTVESIKKAAVERFNRGDSAGKAISDAKKRLKHYEQSAA